VIGSGGCTGSSWCVMYVSDSDGEDGKLECVQRYREQYAGRVQEGDWGLRAWSDSLPASSWPWMLVLRLSVMRGEYSKRPPALEHAHKIAGAVVLEGSRAELALLSYGKKMLKAGSVDGQELEAEGSARGAAGQAG
jgi:hypothetical protein